MECACTSTCASTVRVLMEHCHGEDGDVSAACHQMMFAKDYNGRTPLGVAKARNSTSEVLEYLESFMILTLASASPEDGDLAVMLNPRLDDFQLAVATECLDLIRTASCVEVPDAAAYIMMGFLSPSDAMKRSENYD